MKSRSENDELIVSVASKVMEFTFYIVKNEGERAEESSLPFQSSKEERERERDSFNRPLLLTTL